MPVQTELSIPGEKRISLHSEDLEMFADGWRTDRNGVVSSLTDVSTKARRARIARRVGSGHLRSARGAHSGAPQRVNDKLS
jgi:hypothetical protein